MSNNYFIKNCLCCGSHELEKILDLGVQPPANSYTKVENEIIESFPLGLNICPSCWHAQLTYCVARNNIFDRYTYVSGTSGTLKKYFDWFATCLSNFLSNEARVLELAANDGSFISALLQRNIDASGIDPAKNIVSEAQKAGLPIKCGYWPESADLVSGTFNVIVCMNVVAHVDKPKEFIAACKDRLAPNGVLLIQPSQVRMFENAEFDTCYHEHISFFNSNSISILAESVGLKLYNSFLVKIHGDSPVYILGLPDSPPDHQRLVEIFRHGEFSIDEKLADYENKINLYSLNTYKKFEEKSNFIIDSLKEIVSKYRSKGYDIVFVGAAAKAMTIVNACGIKPDHFLDESDLKIGLFTPGLNCKIEPLETIKTIKTPTLFIITAWNFRHELVDKLKRIGTPSESKFYSYFPKPEFLK